MMFKLAVLLVMMFGGSNAKHDDAKNHTQLSVHLENIVEQMTRMMDEFQVKMERLKEKVEELPLRMERQEEMTMKMERLEEKMDVGINRSNSMMEMMERLEEKVEELPARMERLEEKMDVGMNGSNNIMEEKMERLKEKMEEIPRKVDKLENKMDCEQHFASDSEEANGYLVLSTGDQFKVLNCEIPFSMTSESGWIVIQRRVNADVDFYRGWQEYKMGFGDLQGSFWIGLENIYNLCSRNCQLNVTMSKEPNRVSAYEQYDEFSISDEKDKYRLHVNGYVGTAGNELSKYHNGMQFTTKDNDNDRSYYNSCAELRTGAFWFNNCGFVNPNGQYLTGHFAYPHGKGIFWLSYTDFTDSMQFIEMKVKPTS